MFFYFVRDSPKLTAITKGLYHYRHWQTKGNETKKYCPGSKWWYKCQASCYNQPGLPVIEKQKVTFIHVYEKCKTIFQY